VYPLAFIWKTDLWTTLKNILKDAMNKRRPEGFLDSAKDFMLDRLDDTLEVVARLPGHPIWAEMKENGGLATTNAAGGARLTLAKIAKLLAADPSIELHLAGHSAGAIFLAPLAQVLTTNGTVQSGPAKGMMGLGLKISSCTLWAPACTVGLFKGCYLPGIENKTINRFALFTLKDGAEQDDHCANIYHKSLLYLVSNAFEDRWRIPLFRDGEPILGMEKFILKDPVFKVSESTVKKDNPPMVELFGLPSANWVRSPNGLPEGSANASEARHHGDFDDEDRTVQATLARILDASSVSPGGLQFRPSTSARSDKMRKLSRVLG
jgi:hypothetical protein